MALVKDFDLEDDLDIMIFNGDFKVSFSDQNHVVLILETYLGSFKQFPLVGLGIRRFEAASISPLELKREISVQLAADAYKVDQILVFPDYTYKISADRIV